MTAGSKLNFGVLYRNSILLDTATLLGLKACL